MTEPLWIFGYGSLVWRPAFPHAERVPAQINGFVRRFWQLSPDHRGTPERPGRVVTLVERPGATVGGMAYRVEDAARAAVLSRLDHREQGGYGQHRLPLHLGDGRSPAGTVYVATSGNDHWGGPADIGSLAAEVVGCTGPSGSNCEYVFRLEEALAQHQMVDSHVAELAAAIRALLPT